MLKCLLLALSLSACTLQVANDPLPDDDLTTVFDIVLVEVGWFPAESLEREIIYVTGRKVRSVRFTGRLCRVEFNPVYPNRTLHDTENLAEEIRAIPGILAAAPETIDISK